MVNLSKTSNLFSRTVYDNLFTNDNSKKQTSSKRVEDSTNDRNIGFL